SPQIYIQCLTFCGVKKNCTRVRPHSVPLLYISVLVPVPCCFAVSSSSTLSMSFYSL
uniref:Uncharacterized protein n=1 Tax=Macaca fascicularis TaxID=9541 RepID=A0A7N9CSF2_MACFA